MTREELIGTNASIVKGVTENLLQHSPNAIVIVVSEPNGYYDVPDFNNQRLTKKPDHWHGWHFG